MYRTYDLSDQDISMLKEACERMAESTPDESVGYKWDKLRERLIPVCMTDERLVYTVQAFREHIDGWIDDDKEIEIINTTSDEEIAKLLGDDYIYSAWHDTCKEITEILVNKAKEKHG